MSEERMAILRMLSEGKISVDEAGKLLDAVSDASQDAAGGAQEARGKRRPSRDFGDFFEEIGDEVRRAVSSVHQGDVGHTVRQEVDKAVKTVQGLDLGTVVNEVVDQVKNVVGEAVEGTSYREVVDEADWTFSSAAILAIDPETSNGHILFRAGADVEVKVLARTKIKAATREEAEAFAERVIVSAECTDEMVRVHKEHPKPPHGVSVTINYEIEGPKHLDLDLRTVNGSATANGSEGKVNAQTTNGNLALDGGRGQMQLRTQNGNIHATLLELRYEGLFTTTNGNIDVQFGEGQAPLTATSTNGNVDLRLPADLSGALDARTTNGQVCAAADLGTMDTVKRTLVEGPIGTGGDVQVRVHTLNGNVSVGRMNGEE